MAGKMTMKKSDSQAINIQSYIRVRPLSSKEKKANVLEFGKKEVTIKSGSESSKINKTLLYDRVFDEDSKQIVVYNAVVKPMIKEVLQGYNCTVFAYGQTGTGKTYTMTGNQDCQTSLEESVHAGIVPRAMRDLFHELSIQACEFQVSVSYMELYNEKLRSLLKDADDTDLKLIDDLEGGVLVKGLLPTPVKTREEAFALLQQGADKRQVAATQMNVNSSRSHTIFTINVNIKENVVAGQDDVLRCGKLHLVDLAGSENVSKSGASENIHKSATGVNKRLAEAANINKSLLTLGRVITCLTENNPHIPYRESKLTRFLQDSLGGKTKTCIIATISPAQSNLDETESTLNYASKARSIKNKPVRNQTISKKDFMQVASEEIMKLRKDLEAVRQGEGFYISKESHEEMISRMKELDDQVKDWHAKYFRIKESYEQTKEMFSSLSSDFDDKCAEYEELETMFKIESQTCQEKMSDFAKEIIVREYFIKEYKKTEESLTEQAKTCKSVLENLLEQSNLLHDKIDRKKSNELGNVQMLNQYKKFASNQVADFQCKLDLFLDEEKHFAEQVLKYAGDLKTVLDEENNNVLSMVSSFEEQLKDSVQPFHQEALSKQKEFTNEFLSCKALGEETIKHSVSLYRDVIKSHILPSMKNVQDQLNLLINVAQEGNHSFLQKKEQIKELVSNISESHRLLTQIGLKTINENETLRKRNEEVSKRRDNVHSHANQITEKLQQVLGIIMSVDTECSSIKAEANAIGEEVSATQAGVAVVEALTQSSLELLGSVTSDVEAVVRVCDDQSDCQNALSSKIEENVNCLLSNVKSQVQNIESGVEEKIQQVQSLCEKQQETLAKLEPSVKKFTDHVISQTSTVYEERVNQFVNEVQNKIAQEASCVDNILREQNGLSWNKLQMMNEKPELCQIITNLEDNLKSINYSEYVPQGSTPQRVTDKDQLDYPRKFISTAPRTVLVKKLREMYPETESVPNENLALEPYLPAGPFFNGDIQNSAESSPVSVASVRSTPLGGATRNRIRRSTSLPELNPDNSVFLAPSPLDNKENTRTKNVRRAHKSKIPEVSSAKKKTILGTVQDVYA